MMMVMMMIIIIISSIIISSSSCITSSSSWATPVEVPRVDEKLSWVWIDIQDTCPDSQTGWSFDGVRFWGIQWRIHRVTYALVTFILLGKYEKVFPSAHLHWSSPPAISCLSRSSKLDMAQNLTSYRSYRSYPSPITSGPQDSPNIPLPAPALAPATSPGAPFRGADAPFAPRETPTALWAEVDPGLGVAGWSLPLNSGWVFG